MMSLRVLRVIEGQIDSNSKFRTIALTRLLIFWYAYVPVRTRTSVRGAGEVYTSNREVLPIFFPGRVVYGSVVCTAPHRPGGVYILCIPVEVYRSVLYSYTLLYFHFFWLLISTLLPYLYVVPVQYSY